MVAPITNNPDDCSGHIISLAIAHTSTGTANSITIPDGLPMIDLKHAHPVLSAAYIATEADLDISDSSAGYTPANEMARATAPDSAGEWEVNSSSIVKLLTADKNGFAMLTYYAAGSKNT